MQPRRPRGGTAPRRLAAALCLAVAALAVPAVAAATAADAASDPGPPSTPGARRADFGTAMASREVRDSADWALASDDARGRPFVVIDKQQAQVFAFDGHGRLLGLTPALLGMAIGDESVPGIGDRPLALIKPGERTTPSGRFEATIERNLKGQEILWIDYDAGIALHRLVPGAPPERRAQRLASPAPAHRRITFGCINVPASFFDRVVQPAFGADGGIVYVLPESRPVMVLPGADGLPQRRF